MAEIKIKINTDATPIKDLLKNLDGVNTELKEINSSTSLENVAKDADMAEESTKSLKTQLREMTKELQGLEPGSQRFQELAIKAGQLRDTISDTNAVIAATAGSSVENLANGLTSLSSVGIAGFQGLASAQALFGGESEALQQTLVKLQALAGLSSAVKELGGLKDTLTNIKASFGAVAQAVGLFTKAEAAATVATGAQTVATEGATVASNALNVSLLANPIFLLVAAIGAVVGALIYFSEETETATEANDKLSESIERQQAALDRSNEKLTRAADNRVKLLKAQGASSKEVFEAELEQLRVEEDNRLRNLQQTEFNIQDKTALYKRALAEEDEELAKSIKKEIQAERNKYKDLKSLDGQYRTDKLIAETQFTTDEKKEQDRANEELRRKQQEAYKKRLDDQKKYNQERFNAERQFEELRLANLPEGIEKDILLNEEKYNRLIEDTKRNENLLQSEKNKIIAEYEIQRNKTTEDIQKADFAKKQEQAAKELQFVKDEANKVLDELAIIAEENFQATLTEQQRERLAVENKYSDLLNQAQGNAEQIKIIEEAKNREINAIDKRYADERLATIEAEKKARIDAANTSSSSIAAGLNSIQSLSDSIFEIRKSRLEKGSEEELKAAKKQFEINKKLQIAQAVIQGVQATLAAYSSGSAIPVVGAVTGPVFAALAAAASAANIAKIKNSKFEGGGAGGGSSIPQSSASVSSTVQAAVPQFNLFGQGNNANTVGAEAGAQQSQQSQQMNIQSTVSVTEINSTQNKVKVIEERSVL